MEDPTEPETPEVEDVADDIATEQDAPEDEFSDEDGEDNAPELVEVEIDGKVYALPPELRDGYMLRADYTRKTQEMAEQRKALETRITEASEASEAENKAYADKVTIEAALNQFQQVDWDALERQNPMEAQRLFRQYTFLKDQAAAVDSSLQEARSKREAEAQRFAAERFQQSMVELKQAIPDWGEAKAVSLKQFAQETFGFTEEEFKMGLHDARQIKLLNLAYAAAKSPKPKPAQQVTVKPAAKVKGGSAAPKGLDDRLSADEWMRRRQAQVMKH
jgi:hypothetical protein